MANSTTVESLTWAQCEDRNNQWTISERKTKYYVMAHPVQKKRFLTKEDLDAIDPRLSLFLDVHAGPRPGGAGENVYFTMRLWQRKRFLPVARSHLGHINDYVDRIHKVVYIDELNSAVIIEADVFKVAGHPGLQCVPEYGLRQHVAVSFDSFDSYFPGTIGRLRTGLAIGFSSEDLITHMFSKTEAVTPVALPNHIAP